MKHAHRFTSSPQYDIKDLEVYQDFYLSFLRSLVNGQLEVRKYQSIINALYT